MAYALLAERVGQQATALNLSYVVAGALAGGDVELVTVDELLADLDLELAAAAQERPPEQQAVLDALGVGSGR